MDLFWWLILVVVILIIGGIGYIATQALREFEMLFNYKGRY